MAFREDKEKWTQGREGGRKVSEYGAAPLLGSEREVNKTTPSEREMQIIHQQDALFQRGEKEVRKGDRIRPENKEARSGIDAQLKGTHRDTER